MTLLSYNKRGGCGPVPCNKLEQSGLIESRRRNGTIVVWTPQVPHGVAGGDAAVDGLIRTARDAGVRDETLIDLLRGRLASKLNM
jgi:GntR family transcriptional regulator